LRRSSFEPILHTPLLGCRLCSSHCQGIVFPPLLLIEYGADSLHRTVLKGSKLADPSAPRNGRVTPDAQGLLLPLLKNLLHGGPLRFIQVQSLS